MAQSIRAASRDHGRRHPAELLNQVVFDRFGFARTIDDRSARRTLLPQVLAARRGNCLGLGGLYLALGERLGLPLHGVLVPGHFFVSYRPTVGDRYEARDIELLKRGRQMPRSWYRRKYPMPPGSSLYLRPLSWRESLAVFWYNLANDLRQARRYREAIRLYEKVVARLPGFAAAQANLGLSYHRLRQWEKAERAYLRARTINASLPGLQRNLQALHRHRLQRPSAQP